MSIAYDVGSIPVSSKEKRSISPEFWIVFGQLVVLAVAIPSVIILGALLP